MSRLIYADKLIERIEKIARTQMMKVLVEHWINEQPTAYDVDKVIKQLDELVRINMEVLGVRADYVNLAHVIKIVKAGGKCKTNMCIDCSMATYSQGRPYCEKEERHLDSFSYKPDWCSLKVGGIDG